MAQDDTGGKHGGEQSTDEHSGRRIGHVDLEEDDGVDGVALVVIDDEGGRVVVGEGSDPGKYTLRRTSLEDKPEVAADRFEGKGVAWVDVNEDDAIEKVAIDTTDAIGSPPNAPVAKEPGKYLLMREKVAEPEVVEA